MNNSTVKGDALMLGAVADIQHVESPRHIGVLLAWQIASSDRSKVKKHIDVLSSVSCVVSFEVSTNGGLVNRTLCCGGLVCRMLWCSGLVSSSDGSKVLFTTRRFVVKSCTNCLGNNWCLVIGSHFDFLSISQWSWFVGGEVHFKQCAYGHEMYKK